MYNFPTAPKPPEKPSTLYLATDYWPTYAILSIITNCSSVYQSLATTAFVISHGNKLLCLAVAYGFTGAVWH